MVSAPRSSLLALLTGLLAFLVPLAPRPAVADDPAPGARQGGGGDRLVAQLERLPIVDAVRERPRLAEPGTRFFRIWVRLPADHGDPTGPTFRLRVALTHVGRDRPTVLSTSGYGLYSWDYPYRSDVTQLVNGNEVAVEHRFFAPSRPANPDWSSQLTIRQSAADQHRIIRAFQRVYQRPWLATGASKGGMTVTYLRRFHPDDVAGTIAYVAPNDADNDEDGAYQDFLAGVGGDDAAGCRARLVGMSRRLLEERDVLAPRLERYAEQRGWTLRLIGGADRALETAAIETYWAFWQYHHLSCRDVPHAGAISRTALFRWFDQVYSWAGVTDQGIRPFLPYYVQAASQLGWPAPYEEPFADLLRYPGADVPASFLPGSLTPDAFDPQAMADVDAWVRHHGRRMLFVYGGIDPWGAERFDCGAGGSDRDCRVLVAPGVDHSARIDRLPRAHRRAAIREVRSWAGLRTSQAALPRLEARAAAGARAARRALEQGPVGVLP